MSYNTPAGPRSGHVVVPFHARVGIANRFAVLVGGKDDDVRVIELRPEKRAVEVLGPRRCSYETSRVEVVVRADEERAESANGRDVRGRCWADHQRSTIDICFSL
jgi:hypothetical protein